MVAATLASTTFTAARTTRGVRLGHVYHRR
jgi:hypothetical protein